MVNIDLSYEQTELKNAFVKIALMSDLYDTLYCSLKSSATVLSNEKLFDNVKVLKPLERDLLQLTSITNNEKNITLLRQNNNEKVITVRELYSMAGKFWDVRLNMLDKNQRLIVSSCIQPGLHCIEVVFNF